ncbi:MAG: hypothetical protein ACRDTF_19555 [Pseudonocardiaceae bacterium]
MKIFHTARSPRAAEPPGEAETITPVSRAEHSARSASRVLDAERRIQERIAEMLSQGALDEGSAAALDPGIESRGAGWHAEDDEEHENHLTEIDLRIAEAQERVKAAEGTHRMAEEYLKRARQDYLAARQRLGAEPLTPSDATRPAPDYPAAPTSRSQNEDRPPGIRRVGFYSDPRLVVGGIRLDLVVTWTFVGGAVGADVAAFYGILALLFRTDLLLISVGTGGFAAAAVGIAHLIGIGLQRRKAADQHGSSGLLWFSLLSWLALGTVAFLARLYIRPTGQSTQGATSFPTLEAGVAALVDGLDRAVIAAATFAALYLVSGLLAMYASYNAYNPDARAYRRAVRNLDEATTRETATQARLTGAQRLLQAREADMNRAPKRHEAIRRKVEADVLRLQSYARELIAAGLGNPSYTDGLLNKAPRPAGSSPSDRRPA